MSATATVELRVSKSERLRGTKLRVKSIPNAEGRLPAIMASVLALDCGCPFYGWWVGRPQFCRVRNRDSCERLLDRQYGHAGAHSIRGSASHSCSWYHGDFSSQRILAQVGVPAHWGSNSLALSCRGRGVEPLERPLPLSKMHRCLWQDPGSVLDRKSVV